MTKRHGLGEVEPLPERRWTDIEAGVLDRLDGRTAADAEAGALADRPSRRPLRSALLVAAAIAAIGAMGWLVRSAGIGDGAGDRSAIATTHVTTEGSLAHTNAGDVAVEVAPRSSVMVLGPDRDAWMVAIEHGAARFRVPPRGARPAFVVEAGQVRIEVIGTRFEVVREPGSPTASVSVEEGTVRVVALGEVTLVHAGERWPTSDPAPTAARTPAVVDERTSAVAHDEPTTAVAHDEPTTAVIAASGTDRSLPPIGRPRSEPRRRELVASQEPHGIATEAPAEPVPATISAPPPSARERFAQAGSLEPSDPDAALSEYAALAAEGGAWGANALFAQGRLELDLGRTARARSTLERYLARHPEGLNADDARRLLDGIR